MRKHFPVAPLAITTVGAVCVVAAATLAAQQASPVFAVASIKQNMSGSTSLRVGGGSPDRFEMIDGDVMTLVLNAYGLQAFRVVGAPGWMGSERFDVTAKSDTIPTVAQRQLMLKHLLATRFGMVAHIETRPLPSYVLMRQSGAQLGPQLKPWTVDCAAMLEPGGAKAGPPVATSAAPTCGMRGAPGLFAAGGATIDALAQSLSSALNVPVVDETGLLGHYEIVLRWARDDRPNDNAPSLFTAVQEQLGLKLESRRMPGEVLVIDSVERPTPD